jgi:hypothetical protein
MNDDLNPAAKGLVASARRSGRALEPGRRARLKYAVAASVASSAGAAAASLSVAKLVVVGALSAALGSGATLFVVHTVNARRETPPTMAPVRREAPAPPKEPPPARPDAAPAPLVEPPLLEAPTVRRDSRPAPGPEAARESPPEPSPRNEAPELKQQAQATAPERAETPPVASAPSAVALVDELELLRRVLVATQEKRWTDAQRGLEEHGRRFVPAALRTEARALQVAVWCGTGRVDEARRLARELEKTEPLNPAVQRLEGTCANRP